MLNAVEPKAETITFTMPGENVIIEAMTKDASIEEEPNILGTTLIIGTAAAGTRCWPTRPISWVLSSI